ncbi:hypothetical protein [Microbispora rosea]|uniref:hypothetical protein n=1 Tax=Microbispora rosea TaxID=58117 RepID=UPI001180C689|nr:hypothetical protein [Microbispora rosea]GIH51962.1 hypothetical protein Mro03_71410 [Microbispora rosea subsp. rosea]
MTETSSSILNKALRIQSVSRALDLGQKDEQQKQHVRERVQALRIAINALERKISLAWTLQEATGITIDLSSADLGREDLSRKAAQDGLPSNQAFNAATRKLKAATEGIAADIAGNWRIWASDQLGLLPTGRAIMLESGLQKQVREELRRLKSLADSTDISSSSIRLFITGLTGIRETLADAQDPPGPLIALLERIGMQSLTLNQVSDEEIALLRTYSMDHEITLRRRGA